MKGVESPARAGASGADGSGAERVPRTQPPALAEQLLRLCLEPLGDAGACMLGDLRQEHGEMARARGPHAAGAWYRRQVPGIALRVLRDRLLRSGPFYHPPHHGGGDRARRREAWSMTTIRKEAQHAIRSLARAPQYTVAAVLTLALAVAANTIVFSVVNAVLLKPLPYPHADRLVILRHTAPGLNYPRIDISPGMYREYRKDASDIEESAIYRQDNVNLTGDDASPERVVSLTASRTLFPTLGVSPVLGRGFTEEEDAPGGAPAVILSHALWQRRFGGDRAVLGRTLRVDGVARTVVGVMAPDFAFVTPDIMVYTPLAIDMPNAPPGSFAYDAVARLRPRISVNQLRVQLDGIIRRLGDVFADPQGQFKAFLKTGRFASSAVPLKEDITGDARRPLWILLGTAAFVLVIACANVTNLFLVRAEARQRDIAVRAALGAGRGRLARHFLLESSLLSLAAGAVGLLLGAVGLRVLLRVAPRNIPRLDEVRIDPVVMGYAVALVVIVALLLALIPAIRLTSPRALAVVSNSGTRTTAGRDRQRTRQLLVVLQTALALVLLTGSGLMLRTFAQLRAINPGFDAHDVLTFRLSLPAAGYPDAAAAASFHERLLERLRALPGVRAAGAVTDIPLGNSATGTGFLIEDHPPAQGELPPILWYGYASDGYFEAMRIPLLHGSAFESADREATRSAVVVSEALAQRFWPGQDAIGKRLRAADGSQEWRTVVGVVGSVRIRNLREDPDPIVYYPLLSAPPVAGHGNAGQAAPQPAARMMAFALRAPDPEAMAAAVRREVWALDPNLPIASISTLESMVAQSMVPIAFTMLALVIAASLALFLGAIGLYGVISYVVTQRTREIGLRMALGAEQRSVRRMVVWQGFRLSALGLVLGALSSFGLTRLLGSLLYNTSPHDWRTFVAVTALLGLVGLLASWVPARRAARIDPARALQPD